MKKLQGRFLFFFCAIIYSITPLILNAQTAVINEFSADPSVYDGGGGEFIELYCPAGGGNCDISCWVLSDGQGLITIPDGRYSYSRWKLLSNCTCTIFCL